MTFLLEMGWLLLAVGRDDDVLRDEDVHAEPGPYRDGRLHLQVARGDLLACLVDLTGGVASPGLRHAGLVGRDVALATLGGRGEETREGGARDDPPPVVVHLVG